MIYCTNGVSSLRWTRLPGAIRYIGLGWYVAVCLLAGVLLGLWVDGWLGTRPLFLLIGLFLGLGGAFFGLMRAIARITHGNDTGNH